MKLNPSVQQSALISFSLKWAKGMVCLLGTFLLFYGTTMAQEKWVTKGDALFQEREYLKAIEMYEWSLRKAELAPTKVKIGDCYRKLNKYKKAEDWYAQAWEEGINDPRFIIHYGQMLLASEQFDQVDSLMQKARISHPRSELINQFFQAINERAFLLSDSARYEVRKLSLNSKKPDFSPIFFQNGLIFSSSRKQSSTVVYSSKTDEAPLVDLYYSESKGEDGWGRPRKLEGTVNSRRNDGPACLNAKQTEMYFTRDENLEATSSFKANEVRKLKIFKAVFDAGSWSLVGSLPINSDEHAVGHPALSPDERYLYFSSDMPGGYGGTDLYRIAREGESWGEPENLGAKVNTLEDELFPFIGSDGTLYFSSNGHIGLGNLDVFSALEREGKWTQVRNVGFPLNSTRDDFGLIIDGKGERGYFSSNRGGDPTNDDIYEFSILMPQFECGPQEENNYCYRFFEQSTLSEEDLKDLPLVYEWDLGDGNKYRGLEVSHCFEKAGIYEVLLNVIDTTNGFVFLNEASYDLIIEDIEQVYIAGEDLVEVGTVIDYDGSRSNPKNCKIDRYFWNFGNGFSEGKSASSHVFTQPGNYEVSLGVIGIDTETEEEAIHCSTIQVQVMAKAQYEDSLSNREKAPKEFVKLESIVPSLIEKIGDKNYSLRDLDNARYRVQIAITQERIPLDSPFFMGLEDVDELFSNPNYIYTIGDAEDPRSLYPLFLKALSLEFEAAMIIALHEDRIVTGNDSTFWAKDLGETKLSKISLVKGRLLDQKGNPVAAEIYFEDLILGKVYSTIKTNSNGEYEIELPNGRMFGFHAEADGYYPISDFLDLREVFTKLTYDGKLQMIEKEELIRSGLTLRINNIFFATDSYELRPESREELARLLRIMSENPSLKAVVEGHTDNIGSDSYNLRLSQNRAMAVQRELVLMGSIVKNLEAKGFGESKPIATNDTEEGRAKNRRVEFRFVPLKK